MADILSSVTEILSALNTISAAGVALVALLFGIMALRVIDTALRKR